MGQKVSVFRRKFTKKSIPKQVKPLEEAAPPSGVESLVTHTNELQTSEEREIQEVENVEIVNSLEASPHVPQFHHVTDSVQASEDQDIQEVETVKVITPDTSLTAPEPDDQDYVNTPLVLDKDTIEYVKRSRVGTTHDVFLVEYYLESVFLSGSLNSRQHLGTTPVWLSIRCE